MRRSKYKNRTRKYKNRTRKKHRQTNRRRVRRTKKNRMKLKGGSQAGLLAAGVGAAGLCAAAGLCGAAGAVAAGAGAPIDIKRALESSMEQYSAELGDNPHTDPEVDYNTLLCVEKIKALRPLEETRSTSIFMTTGYSYCYMFEEFIDEDYIMFCDWGIGTLENTKKFIKYGIARRNYELSNDLERGKATIEQVIEDGGISHWYSRGPLPMKTYIFLHMNLNDNRHITTLLETINSLGFTITTNNLSNVPSYIAGKAHSQPYYRFFGDELGIHSNCMYIFGILRAYYFNKSDIVSILSKRDMFYDIIEEAVILSKHNFGEFKEKTSEFSQKSLIHWREFDNFLSEMYGQREAGSSGGIM